MDIGDPSDIPSTRKRLPSMQELGAFDVPTPPATPAVRPSPPPAAAAVPSTAAPAPRPTLTPEQLRQALAKADPDTRQKLLRLISGGKAVQQVGSPAPSGARRRNLVMQADPAARRAAPEGASLPKTPAWQTARPSAPPPRPAPRAAAGRAGVEQPLMQIDANTELLDAAAPPRSAADRKAELQAQLDLAQQQAQQQAVPAADKAPAESLAHKVLFPAYDPTRHGEDVHGSSRRRAEGPIEGHFPAPRQPFQATYQHPDGRPMTPEENKVEEVLQAERCEETLSVLARDGVNGLLLSPRDLDAAVGQGLLTADIAATLWKTWAALRPVIHVIEDEPEESPPVEPENATTAADAAGEAQTPALPGDAVTPEPPAAAQTLDAPALNPVPVPVPAPVPAIAPTTAPAPVLPPIAAVAAAPVSIPDPVIDTPTLPLPRTGHEPPFPKIVDARAGPSTTRQRLRAVACGLGWAFIAYCVLATSTRLASLAWHQWGHLWTAP